MESNTSIQDIKEGSIINYFNIGEDMADVQENLFQEIDNFLNSGEANISDIKNFLATRTAKRRPKLPESEKRNKQIIIRLTAKEKQTIMKYAKRTNQTASKLIRKLLIEEMTR